MSSNSCVSAGSAWRKTTSMALCPAVGALGVFSTYTQGGHDTQQLPSRNSCAAPETAFVCTRHVRCRLQGTLYINTVVSSTSQLKSMVDGLKDNLVSACRCLQQWQHTLWMQGQFSRALRCDLCCQPYQQPQFDPSAHLTFWQRVKQRWVQLQSSPEWVLRAWRCCILFGGLVSTYVSYVTKLMQSGKPVRQPACICCFCQFACSVWATRQVVYGLRQQQVALLQPLACACSCYGLAGCRHSSWCIRLWCRAQLWSASCTAPGHPDSALDASAERGSGNTAVTGSYRAQCTAGKFLLDAARGVCHYCGRPVWRRRGGVLPRDCWRSQIERQSWLPGSSGGSKDCSWGISGCAAAHAGTDVTQRRARPAAAQVKGSCADVLR